MTQKQKDLLLKDLCARLPYGVKGLVTFNGNPSIPQIQEDRTIDGKLYDRFAKFQDSWYDNVTIKPYLFPLSSMTEGQRIELYKALSLGYESHYHLSKEWEDFNNSIDNNDLFIPASWVSDLNKMYNYLNKNHFDYRELIHIGLAIDATGLNIY